MTSFVLSFENGTKAVYDNQQNRVFDTNGNPLFELREDRQTYDDALKVSPETPVAKHNAPKTLKIQLGLKCNYSCSYCNQAVHVDDATHTNVQDAEEFIENLDSWIAGAPDMIEFWGGEPWLYWKKIAYMLPKLREKFPDTEFLTITNGSMFNDDIFSLIQEYDISIAISHDAMGQGLRGPDPLKDPEKKMWIDKVIADRAPRGKFQFNTVMCAGNHDPNAINDFFKREYGPDVRSDFEGIVQDYSQGDVGFVPEFKMSDYLDMQGKILEGLFDGNLMGTSYFGGRMQNFIQDMYSGKTADKLWQKCGMDRPDELAVDLKGNAMTCQNTSSGSDSKHHIGTVQDGAALDTSWHWSFRKECSNCPILHICKGSCMYLEGENWSKSCNNEFYAGIPIFVAAMTELAGSKLTAIEGDLIRPDYMIPV